MAEIRPSELGEGLRRFKAYPSYKSSGVEWLGQIPAHWETIAAGRLIDRIEQGWSPVAEDRLANLDEWAVIKLSAVSRGAFRATEHKALPAGLAPDTRYEICPGDVLLTRANTPDLVGEICVVPEVRSGLMLSDLVYRLRLRQVRVIPSFLASWLSSRTGRYQIEVDARGSSQSMVKVSQGLIRAWKVVLPPVTEQRAIAAFLDGETVRIDALVAKKEKLIELLQEKRAALITRAVTKGLDPNVPMKNSGIEWLGEIPAHWDVKRLRWALSVCSGEALSNTQFELAQGDGLPVAVVGGNGVMGYTSRGNLDVPSLAIGRVGALCGNVHLVDPPAWITDNALVVSGIRGFDRGYLALLLRILDLNRWASHNAQPLITGGFVKAQVVCAPPVEEQRAIAAFLDRETSRVGALVSRVRDAIDGLGELRAALITAAVTGKIDVREVAA